VVRVPGYRSGGPGFDSRALQEKKVVGLERGPLSLVSATEELLGRNSSGSGLERLATCNITRIKIKTPCNLVDSYYHFRGTCHLQDKGGGFY
jgi:hypothetical protein